MLLGDEKVAFSRLGTHSEITANWCMAKLQFLIGTIHFLEILRKIKLPDNLFGRLAAFQQRGDFIPAFIPPSSKPSS